VRTKDIPVGGHYKMPQDRQGARPNPNHVPHPLRTPKPPRVYPLAGLVIDDTKDALFHLVGTLFDMDLLPEAMQAKGLALLRLAHLGLDHRTLRIHILGPKLANLSLIHCIINFVGKTCMPWFYYDLEWSNQGKIKSFTFDINVT